MKLKQIGNRWVSVECGWIIINSLEGVLKKLSLASDQSTVFQLVSAKPLVSLRHVWVGAALTIDALQSNSTISKKTELELLVRLSANRQIGGALDLFSLTEKQKQGAVLIGMGTNKKQLEKKTQKLGRDLALRPDPNLFEKNLLENKNLILNSFGITEQQLALFSNQKKRIAIESLVLEKLALLALDA